MVRTLGQPHPLKFLKLEWMQRNLSKLNLTLPVVEPNDSRSKCASESRICFHTVAECTGVFKLNYF